MQEKYKGYLIYGSAIPIHPNSHKWCSQGEVCILSSRNSLVEIKRIPGREFDTEEQAKQHGLEVSRAWIDERINPTTKNRR